MKILSLKKCQSKSLFRPTRLSVHMFVRLSVRAFVTKFFFRLNHLGVTPQPPGLTPHPHPLTPGARSPSGGTSKGPKDPF